MKTTSFLFALLCVLCGQAFAAEKSNILIIVSDDQGYTDTGFNVVSRPQKLPAAATCNAPVSSFDVFATAVAAAGAAMPADKKHASVNLIPHLTGETKTAPHERLFWRVGTRQSHALREGDWKLVRAINQPAELFNLATDLAESKNLAAKNPNLTAKLTTTLDAWDKELVAPGTVQTTADRRHRPNHRHTRRNLRELPAFSLWKSFP